VIEENIERKDARLQSQQDADPDREKIFSAKVNVQGGVQCYVIMLCTIIRSWSKTLVFLIMFSLLCNDS